MKILAAILCLTLPSCVFSPIVRPAIIYVRPDDVPAVEAALKVDP